MPMSRTAAAIPKTARFRMRRIGRRLEVAPASLLDLDRLEERLEVTHAEAAGAVALDDLEEEGRPILDRAGEDLQEIALLVPVGFDAELLEHLDRHADVPDPVRELLVVGVRHPEELDAALAERAHRADDVLGAQRDVLGAGIEV